MRAACTTVAVTFALLNTQFLMKKESLGGWSEYFLQMHYWDVVFIMFLEIAVVILLQPKDVYSVDQWVQASDQ